MPENKDKSIVIRAPEGMRRRSSRVGRGPGSGWGKTAGKGHKGQKARSGKKLRPGFEGGQMPLQRRVPKRGFTNVFKKEYHIINLGVIDKLAKNNDILDLKRLAELKLIRTGNSVKLKNRMIKVLGDGELTKTITVWTHRISKSASDKILKNKGKIFLLSDRVKLSEGILKLEDAKIEKKEYSGQEKKGPDVSV